MNPFKTIFWLKRTKFSIKFCLFFRLKRTYYQTIASSSPRNTLDTRASYLPHNAIFAYRISNRFPPPPVQSRAIALRSIAVSLCVSSSVISIFSLVWQRQKRARVPIMSDVSKQQRKSFALQTKYDIVKRLQGGVKQAEICKEMCLSKSTVATIWKERNNVLYNFENENVKAKKIKKSVHDNLDKSLLKWFSQQRDKNITISGAVLQSKANELGTKLEGSEFNCSRSWIERFKRRHDISSGKIAGEAASVNMDVVKNWLKDKWPKIRENFKDSDIFNADETGLFYKLTPDKTLRFRGERCVGGKLSKERITVLVAANLDGTQKRKLLVIGKSRNPRCFKHCHQLPVNYKSNKKAWMTSEIFTDELRSWNDELHRKNRKILLLVDNCPAHPDVKNLSNIKLVFMPPNSSSILQPMDQGVIYSLKSNYRRMLLAKMINSIDNGAEQFSVSLLDAINFIHMAWQNVSAKTINNCFRHAGFAGREDNFESEDELPLAEWMKKTDSIVTDLQPEVEEDPNSDFEDFVHFDDDIISTEFLTDEDIIATVSASTPVHSGDEDTSDQELEMSVNLPVPTISQALQHLDAIRTFLLARNTTQDVLNNFAIVESHVNNISFCYRAKQSKITDFFK